MSITHTNATSDGETVSLTEAQVTALTAIAERGVSSASKATVTALIKRGLVVQDGTKFAATDLGRKVAGVKPKPEESNGAAAKKSAAAKPEQKPKAASGKPKADKPKDGSEGQKPSKILTPGEQAACCGRVTPSPSASASPCSRSC